MRNALCDPLLTVDINLPVRPEFNLTGGRSIWGRPDDFEAEYETQFAYLKRLGLLLPGELEQVEHRIEGATWPDC